MLLRYNLNIWASCTLDHTDFFKSCWEQLYVHSRIERKVQRSHIALPPTCSLSTLSLVVLILTRKLHFLQLVNLHWHQRPCFTWRLTPCCTFYGCRQLIMMSIHCYDAINKSPPCYLFTPPSPNPSSFYCVPSSAFPRMSYSWNPAVGSLWR